MKYNRVNMFKTILIGKKSDKLAYTENVKILRLYNQKVVYDKRKERANSNSMSEYDWTSGKKRRC